MGGDSKSPTSPAPAYHSMDYYAKCMFGGVLACGLTHAAVVTLDVAKCRAQAHSLSGRWPKALVPGIQRIYAEEGAAGLRKGWVPTFFGYGAQGLFKFGLNEFFKDFYTSQIGGPSALDATWKKLTLWALASGSAEIFADVALCPFEMTKVKMQVPLPGDPGCPPKLIPAFQWMSANVKETKFPYGSIGPLWGRQVPYTMIKFVAFYQAADWVYATLDARGTKKADVPAPMQLGITFLCGYWAGIFCAVATQPMDNLVSMKGNAANKDKTFGQMAREMGTVNLFTKGLGVRVLMVGTLTGLQWWIYGTWKTAMGFGSY